MLSTVVCSMVCPAIAAASAVFGFVTIAWVIPGGRGLVRNGLERPDCTRENELSAPGAGVGPPIGKGTVLTGFSTGPPATENDAPSASTEIAVGNRGHARHACRFCGSGGGRHRGPDAWLNMERSAGGGIADLLQIGGTEEVDVVL